MSSTNFPLLEGWTISVMNKIGRHQLDIASHGFPLGSASRCKQSAHVIGRMSRDVILRQEMRLTLEIAQPCCHFFQGLLLTLGPELVARRKAQKRNFSVGGGRRGCLSVTLVFSGAALSHAESQSAWGFPDLSVLW